MDENTRLENRFRVVHGAQDKLEVDGCAGMVWLLPAIALSVEDALLRDKATTALMEYLCMVLLAHGTPPQRIRDLIAGVSQEIATICGKEQVLQ